VAREGESDTVAEILREMTPLSRAELGCLQYDAYRHPDDPNTFVLFERYVDEAALEAHTASPHAQELVFGKALPLLEFRERTSLIPLA
jgi:quinol monooxygenase YgiN